MSGEMCNGCHVKIGDMEVAHIIDHETGNFLTTTLDVEVICKNKGSKRILSVPLIRVIHGGTAELSQGVQDEMESIENENAIETAIDSMVAYNCPLRSSF